MMPWRVFVVRTGVAAGLFGLAMFAALRLAAADPGGPTRPELAFSGVLSRDTAGAPFVGDTSLVFTFARGATSVCSVTTRSITFTAAMNGAFTVPVPIGPPCPADLFDGADVTYNVQQSQPTLTTIATNVPVTPVPYARFADTAGGIVDHACPAGYARDAAASTATVTVCARTVTLGSTEIRDELVKVGTGRSAFWVDRYEASVWGSDGVQRGSIAGDSAGYRVSLARNGQWAAGARDALKAYSHRGVTPSRNITWFQAAAVCRASGKRLIARGEWLAAADGLTAIDPLTAVNGNATGETRCNTAGTDLRRTGSGSGCASSWGAQDMIGNAAEWTDEWHASVGMVTTPGAPAPTPGAAVAGVRVNNGLGVWGVDFGNDTTNNIAAVVLGDSDNQIGMPAAVVRGGNYLNGTQAGVFHMALQVAPTVGDASFGLRCVVPD